MPTPDEGMPRAPIRITGHPSAEEVAALVVVLSAVGGDETPYEGGRTALWSDHAHAVGLAPAHGAGAWRASARPR